MTRWRILALLFAARVGLGFQFQAMGAVGTKLSDAFGLDNVQIGLLIGLFMAPGLILALPVGFSGRFASDRVLASLGLALLALGGAVSAAASVPGGVGLGRLLAGGGALFATLYFTKMVADWFVGREISLAMSVLVMSWPFGIAMGQVGHTWLAETYGWRVPFASASAWCGVAAFAVLTLYHPPHDLARSPSAAVLSLTAQEWHLIICAGTAWGVFNAGYVIFLTFGPNMLMSLGRPVISAASVISVGSWLMILSGTICGIIADRFGRRDTILLVCMTSAVIALFLLRVPGAGLPASLLFGLLAMAPAGVIMSLAGQAMRPERRAFGMGVFYSVYYAIMTAAPPISGAIYDVRNHPEDALLFGMILFATVVPAAFAFKYIKAGSPTFAKEGTS